MATPSSCGRTQNRPCSLGAPLPTMRPALPSPAPDIDPPPAPVAFRARVRPGCPAAQPRPVAQPGRDGRTDQGAAGRRRACRRGWWPQAR
eukprot:scaffold15956_cov93-Isochrysis_galbana.AAC.2